MASPSTTHVIEIETGIGEPAFVPLVLGQELQPISVGKKGMWRIESARVLDVHAFVYFDGQSLFLQSTDEENAASVDGFQVGKAWTELHAPCTIEIGAAQLRFRSLTAEARSAPSRAGAPARPATGRLPPVRQESAEGQEPARVRPSGAAAMVLLPTPLFAMQPQPASAPPPSRSVTGPPPPAYHPSMPPHGIAHYGSPPSSGNASHRPASLAPPAPGLRPSPSRGSRSLGAHLRAHSLSISVFALLCVGLGIVYLAVSEPGNRGGATADAGWPLAASANGRAAASPALATGTPAWPPGVPCPPPNWPTGTPLPCLPTGAPEGGPVAEAPNAKSLERQAVDLVAAGDAVRALATYDELVRREPNNRVYAEAARILRVKLDASAP